MCSHDYFAKFDMCDSYGNFARSDMCCRGNFDKCLIYVVLMVILQGLICVVVVILISV